MLDPAQLSPTPSSNLTQKPQLFHSIVGGFTGDQKVPPPPASSAPSDDVLQDQLLSALPPEEPPTEPQLPPEPPEPEFPTPEDLQRMASAIPLAVDQATDTLNPPTPTGSATAKEHTQPGFTIERPSVDVPGVQLVEQLDAPEHGELPPEVESYIEHVANHHEQLPAEIVIADQQSVPTNTQYLAKPVIVLPITPEVEKVGAHKATTFSVRWLVEWSRKIMKIFSGRVVYHQA